MKGWMSVSKYVPYCPGQVAMGARSSSTKIEGGQLQEVLKWFCASAHSGCKVSVCIVALPTLHRGQSDGGESCIVLESGPTRSLVAKLLQCLSLVVREIHIHDAGEELCEQGYRRVCVKL